MDITSNIRRKPLAFAVGAAIGGLIAAIVAALIVEIMFGRVSQHGANRVALIILPITFFAGAAYVQFHDKHGWGLRWLWSKVSSPLAQPAQRVLFLCSIFGIALMILAALVNRYSFGDFVENVVLDPYFSLSRHTRYWSTLLFWSGLPLFVVTSIAAYFYQSTLGKLLSWISSGSSSRG